MENIMQEPFHEGERWVQDITGEKPIADRNGRVITREIMPKAIPFLEEQPYVFVGYPDAQGDMWVSMLYGQTPFVTAQPDAVIIHISEAQRQSPDPLWKVELKQAHFGLLAIDFLGRRRLRVNGSATAAGDAIHLAVRESYPNCPKYIQRRHYSPVSPPEPIQEVSSGQRLTQEQMRLIYEADTLFVSSMHPDSGADVSHRGGKPGFAEVRNGSTVRIPDYPGNSMFNTFGNLKTNPAVGLLVYDFYGHRVLQLTGQARLLLDEQDEEQRAGGTKRFWEIDITRWVQHTVALSLQWEYLDASPFNP